MSLAGLVKKNLRYFWRTNAAVVLGVATAVAVLAGALLVGDSVRASLRDLFLQRLGRTSHVITATNFFREQLASDIQSQPRFAGDGFEAACPLLIMQGSASEPTGARGSGVQVYGVDERFWKFHGKEGQQAPQNREVFLSQSLAHELNSQVGDSLLVRIEKPSDVPRESLYGRKEDVGRTLRLTIKQILTNEDLGEFSIRPQQTAVRAVFASLSLLQRELEQTGKVNTILVSEKAASSGAADARSGALEQIVKSAVTLDDYNVTVRVVNDQQAISVERSSTLVDDALADKVMAMTARSGLSATRIFSYVVNNITDGQHSIPYSLVSALDDSSIGNLMSGAKPLAGNDGHTIILNEWAARDLGARLGDKVSLEYFVWEDNGHLATKSAQFEVSTILTIAGLAADRNLVPDYPGISESESISDWDPPFPVDLSRIRKQDEDYWKQYRTTPKAFIRLTDGQTLWQSRFGRLTSLRLSSAAGLLGDQSANEFRRQLTESLDPAAMGMLTIPVRAQGLAASRGATDFGEYFLYFSFFLVISALLLTSLFFKLGIEQRLREIGIMQAVGFPESRIRAQFLIEGVLLAFIGSMLGLLGAVAYGQFMMYGLRTWWVDAVGTTMLRLHISPLSLVIGGLGGIAAAMLCIFWTLRKLRRMSARSLIVGSLQAGDEPRLGVSKLRLVFALVLTIVGVLLLFAAIFRLINQTAGFFGSGTLLLVAMLCFQSVWLRRAHAKSIRGTSWLSLLRLGFRNTSYRPARSVLCIALIASATFIIVAVDAFRRDSSAHSQEKKSGSGGYPLLAESLLPLIHDPNNAAGREGLNLAGDENLKVLENVHFTRFRLRSGDDASCLNLYQPRNPRILGASDDFIQSDRFAFQSSIAGSMQESQNPWLLLNRELGNGVVPVIADANSLTYVLHLGLGDEFVLNRSDGPVRLRVMGALSDSIFQSELIMSERNFVRLFPREEGHRFFLIDAPDKDLAGISTALEDRLTDFGFDVVPTSERLANFHRVENTYLSTFQMLGGLGLLLGTLGLAAILLRNILERRRELALLRAVGYNSSHFTLLVIAENALLLCSGLAIGVVSAALAIAPIFFSRGGQLPHISLGGLLLGVLICGLVVSIVATLGALRAPLIPALRTE